MKSLLISCITCLGLQAFAAPPPMMEMTPEQRKQMADMHTRVASCLNSNKSMQECHNEMMKNCPHMERGMGSQWGCPMMGSTSSPESKEKKK